MRVYRTRIKMDNFFLYIFECLPKGIFGEWGGDFYCLLAYWMHKLHISGKKTDRAVFVASW